MTYEVDSNIRTFRHASRFNAAEAPTRGRPLRDHGKSDMDSNAGLGFRDVWLLGAECKTAPLTPIGTNQ